MSQDAYVREEGYKEAEAKYQEKLTAREEPGSPTRPVASALSVRFSGP
jgi:hypothetical protein